ncbi:MAG: ABC transporter substrate-binding protein [Bryobacteraceae bacterium]|nr:ABC transporter substrate-binding protein [Bryobacteraceae bacterium]
MLHAPLIRIHPGTQMTEGVLAESWTLSADGREMDVRLRPHLRFSDGKPLTADDVLFTFAVHLDARVASPQREALRVGGQPIRVSRTGERGLRFQLVRAYAPGERLLAGIAILPRHLLAKAHEEGRLSQMWTIGSPAAEIAGAGPFRLRSMEPGRRIILERNPHYFKKARTGAALPWLDEMEFVFAPGEDAQVARLLSGEADLIAGFGGSSYRAIEASGAARGVRAADAGPGLDYTLLLFNLNSGGPERASRAWFELDAFRRAVSMAVDRAAIARLVYRGRASAIWGPITPARRMWFDAAGGQPPQSASGALELLRSAGFRQDQAGSLLDSSGKPVRFTILANSGNPAYTQTGIILEQDLKKIGIDARLVPMEFRSLVEQVVTKRDYDAAIMALRPGDADPVADMNVFVSEGKTRLWNLGGKSERPWEVELDRLMKEQLTARDPAKRRELFHRVQQVFAQQMPMVCLVSPNLLYAARENIHNLQPGAVGDAVLWNADELFLAPGIRRR